MIRALVIFAVLVVLGSAAMWALVAYTRRLDGKGRPSQTPSPAIRGTQTMATQMASGYEPPSMVLSPATPEIELCGAQGPIGMRCDQPPHDGVRHADDDLTWIDGGGPIPWPPVPRPTHLGNTPIPPPARGQATP